MGNIALFTLFAATETNLNSLDRGYIPLILVGIPSNLLLRKIAPWSMLPCLNVLYGTGTASHSLVTTHGGLFDCGLLLGLCEGGIFPGLHTRSCCKPWYVSAKLTRRLSIEFQSLSCTLSGFCSPCQGATRSQSAQPPHLASPESAGNNHGT